MREVVPWLGLCHIRENSDISPEARPTLAAVWADSIEGFEREMHVYTNANGQQMIWAEEVLPADKWVQKHPERKDALRLAGKVGEKQLVAVGAFGAGVIVGINDPDLGPEYLTITEHKIAGLPDQSNLPFWEQNWISPELKELLFGAPETDVPLRTYFIVDATLRTKIKGIFDLDTLEIPVRCLFKGNAAQEQKEVAPYLIDMTLPDEAWKDNDKVPVFHKDFFANHWGQNTGIFIRTAADIDDVWGHFRKFTRVQMEDDKRWVFFRFWDPRILPDYLQNIQHNPQSSRSFCTAEETAQYQFLIATRDGLLKSEPNMELLDSIERTRFLLRYQDFSSISDKKKAQRIRRISERIKADFSSELSGRSFEDIQASVASSVRRFTAFGFKGQERLHFLAAWGVFYGDKYEEKDPDGILLRICKMELSENEKFKQFKDRIESLRTTGEVVR